MESKQFWSRWEIKSKFSFLFLIFAAGFPPTIFAESRNINAIAFLRHQSVIDIVCGPSIRNKKSHLGGRKCADHKIWKEQSDITFLIRGGSSSDDSSDYDSETEVDEYDDSSSEEETLTRDEIDSSDTEYDDTSDNYDEEEYDDSDDSEDAQISSKSLEDTSGDEYDEPFSIAPMHEMGITLGIMMLCNKLDLTNKKIIRLARFAFISYVVLTQIFLIYVRIKAKAINNRTPITINNPISSLLQSKLTDGDSAGAAGSDMVKNIASSFLTSQSTIVEYDLQQAKSMNNSLLFPTAMLWFLHFKLNQVHPLFFQTATGFKELITSPLFQVYGFGKNLERPFKTKSSKLEEMQQEEGNEQNGYSESDTNSDESDEGDDESSLGTKDEIESSDETGSDDSDDEYDSASDDNYDDSEEYDSDNE